MRLRGEGPVCAPGSFEGHSLPSVLDSTLGPPSGILPF